ncbi:uncharacterized protein TNIN_113301 [Trichonephila inaurata madagascariensis]|uniref:C2H2-type domain-containing protein n=1 Tax=Trichonephila inaurata madagascariensis TaxID=2747483 RepID=A0A8X6K3H7_9ARAC|nr:uncharacterized protein TNIN_113301 [Trichonephila inaurata madagascariensis]
MMKQVHNESPSQKNANITRRSKSNARVKVSASMSSLMKCSNVCSKETPNEQNLPGRLLNNKENEIGCNDDDKHTNRSGSVEGFQENSMSVANILKEKPNFPKNHLTHIGESPHVCEICKMRFRSKEDLEKHYRLHSGEFPLKCEVCGKGFNYKRFLIAHLAHPLTGISI